MSLELNKIAAAILTGGVIAMGSGFAAEVLVHPHELEESVYKVAALEEGGGMEAAAEQPGSESVLSLLASAEASEGERVARACGACHSFEEGGPNKVGPNLWNILNENHASVDDYAYSDALKGMSDKPWSYEEIDAFLANPKEYAPGTKMSFAGVKSPEDRAKLIAYLRSMSDSPPPLPSEEEMAATQTASDAEPAEAGQAAQGEAAEGGEPAAEQQAAAGEGGGNGVLAQLASADTAAGAKTARACNACHSFDKGGPNKVGPNLYGVVGADIASHEGYKYSDALAGKEGEWSYENLSAFLTAPKDWAPGTKMSFAGVKKPEDLANLIAYLREQSDNPPPLPE